VSGQVLASAKTLVTLLASYFTCRIVGSDWYTVQNSTKSFSIYVVNIEVVLPAIQEAIFFKHLLGCASVQLLDTVHSNFKANDQVLCHIKMSLGIEFCTVVQQRRAWR